MTGDDRRGGWIPLSAALAPAPAGAAPALPAWVGAAAGFAAVQETGLRSTFERGPQLQQPGGVQKECGRPSLRASEQQAAKKEGTKTLQDSPATSGHAPWRPQNAAGGSRRKQ